MNKKFKTVVLGGTFDHLHKGHKEFLKFAFSQSEKVIICITSDEYIRKVSSIKYQVSSIESYKDRKTNLEKFLSQEKVVDRGSIILINDVYGIAISPEYKLDALIVVKKTLEGAQAVSDKRKELGLLPLEIVIAPLETGEDGKVISSARIRNGEIDRDGKLYINPLWLTRILILPESLRKELSEPLCELIENEELGNLGESLITVGDITTQKFNKLSLNQKISVVDFNVGRKKRFDKISELGFLGNEEIIKVKNPAGQITPELFQAVITAFSKEGRVVIEVLGEEDLAVLPVILAAPLDVVVFYGQPASPETNLASRGGLGKGIVKVVVSEEVKQKAYSLLTEFKRSS